MSHPSQWPGIIDYSPIGSTAATYLLEYLAPEEDADVLLLGCGDPRSILFSLYTRSKSTVKSSIDITCCDIEPAILARNIILFTLLYDHEVRYSQSMLWSIWFNLYLDEDSYALFVQHCTKLIRCSETLDTWRENAFSSIISFCSQDTLNRVRNVWLVWQTSPDISQQDAIQAMQSMQKNSINTVGKLGSGPLVNTARSAGLLYLEGLLVFGDGPRVYWKEGTLNPRSNKLTQRCEIANPTLHYASAPGSRLNHATFPLHDFHLARGLAPLVNSSTNDLNGVIADAFDQFGEWCTATRSALLGGKDAFQIRIRFFTGDALTFCPALYAYASGSRASGHYIKPWCTALIELDGDDYLPSAIHPAPSKFNVVDTSSLTDHVGLLNILIVTIPLLSPNPSSVIYTESHLRGSNCVSNEGFRESVCADPAAFQLLFGISPVSSCFYLTSHSNIQEILMQKISAAKDGQVQNNERVAWKNAAGSAAVFEKENKPLTQAATINFKSGQLSALLWDIYRRMFIGDEWLTKLDRLTERTAPWYDHFHYVRGSFVALLDIARRRLPFVDWEMTLSPFLALVAGDEKLKIGRIHYLDLLSQLHLYGFVDLMRLSHFLVIVGASALNKPCGRFTRWVDVPAVVRVVFVVPREYVTRHKDIFSQVLVAPGPGFQVDTDGPNVPPSMFSSLHMCFGRVISSPGRDGQGPIIIEEDTKGIQGESPLVVSFWMPMCLVLGRRPMASKFGLSLHPTPSVAGLFLTDLGQDLRFFSVNVHNEQHLFFSTELPRWLPSPSDPSNPSLPDSSPSNPSNPSQPNSSYDESLRPSIQVALSNKPIEISTLTMRVDIMDLSQKQCLLDGANVSFTQESACKVIVRFSEHNLDCLFPYPIDGNAIKIRIARKSAYIEVIAPIWRPSVNPWKASINRFPISRIRDRIFTSWNLHRVVLESLPVLKRGFSVAHQLSLWHETSQKLALSDREYAIVTDKAFLDKPNDFDALAGVKNGLCTLFIDLGNRKVNRTILLDLRHRSPSGDKEDIRIVFGSQRMDLTSNTVVADGFILPSKGILSNTGITLNMNALKSLDACDVYTIRVTENQMRAWKQLLPAFVERCRQWTHQDSCEYISAGHVPVSYERGETPICSCGHGQDIDEFVKLGKWAIPLAPYVTRAAISSIFALSYLEGVLAGDAAFQRMQSMGLTLGPGSTAKQGGTNHSPKASGAATAGNGGVIDGLCAKCNRPGKPKLLACGKCLRVKYCSVACQKEHWGAHKLACG